MLTCRIKDLVGEWSVVTRFKGTLAEDHVKLVLPSVRDIEGVEAAVKVEKYFRG